MPLLAVPRIRRAYTILGDRSFDVAVPRVWNSLPAATVYDRSPATDSLGNIWKHIYSGPGNRSALWLLIIVLNTNTLTYLQLVTVLAPWAGHFQCWNVTIFFKWNTRKRFHRTSLGNCYDLKLPKCWLQFKDKFVVLFIMKIFITPERISGSEKKIKTSGN